MGKEQGDGARLGRCEHERVRHAHGSCGRGTARRRRRGGKGRRAGEGKPGGGRGAAAGEGEGRVREALHGRENEGLEGILGTTIEVSHRRRRPSLEPRRKLPIDGDSEVRSMNRTHCDEALDETNAAVSLDSANDARIGSNCSPELSPKLEPLRTSASNSGS
jgi:hypothetical protein